ncbi:MAG: hypothetical protein WDA24_10900 [Tissierellales bacterium]
MFPNIETMTVLPKEISMFKNYINEQLDPIRREIFCYSLISYIFGNITPFPINIESNYNNYYENDKSEEYINYLALSYLKHKIYISGNDGKKIKLSSDDLYYSKYFVKAFFDYDMPIKDRSTEEILWVYPKKSVRLFISESFFNKRFSNYYYDELTLAKLIMIMAGFSRYEINNLDGCINEELKQINYPTLILANIGLYEKNFIKIEDDINCISVFLDVNVKEENEKIFLIDRDVLKKTILRVINETEKLEYTMQDFI